MLDFVKRGKEIRKKLIDHIGYYRDERLGKYNRQSTSVFGKTLRQRYDFPWAGVIMIPYVFVLFGIGGARTVSASVMLYIMTALTSLIWIQDIYQSWWKVKKRNKQLDNSYKKRFKNHSK